MGIRMDQFKGLPPGAVVYLAEHEVPQEMCPACKRLFPRNLEVIGHYTGMFDNQYPLHRHMLKDGRVADEFLQMTPWDSGPMFYLGLRVSDGLEFIWPEDTFDGFAAEFDPEFDE